MPTGNHSRPANSSSIPRTPPTVPWLPFALGCAARSSRTERRTRGCDRRRHDRGTTPVGFRKMFVGGSVGGVFAVGSHGSGTKDTSTCVRGVSRAARVSLLGRLEYTHRLEVHFRVVTKDLNQVSYLREIASPRCSFLPVNKYSHFTGKNYLANRHHFS